MNVTVEELYVNPDHFQGKDTPIYTYGGVASGGGDNIKWQGTTVYGVGTYVDPTTIQSNADFMWNGILLMAGDIAGVPTVKFGSSDYTFLIGSNDSDEYGGIELIGNQTVTDERIGDISFINGVNDATVCEIFVVRDDNNLYGSYVLKVAGAGGLFDSYRAERLVHRWWANDVERAALDANGFYAVDAGMDIGTLFNPWADVYLTGTINFNDTNTQIWEDGSSNLTFKDANAGTIILSDFITTTYAATTLNVVTSDGFSGDVDSLASIDDDILQVEEASGSPGFNIQVDFNGVASFNNILMYAYYHGGANHSIHVEVWNPTTTTWVEVFEFTDEGTFTVHNIPILNGTDYLDSAGQVEIRIYHDDSGITSHYLEIEYLVLQNSPSVGGGGVTDHGALVGLADNDHPQYALAAAAPSYGSEDEIPHMNTGGTDFDYNAAFWFSGTGLHMGTSASGLTTTFGTDGTIQQHVQDESQSTATWVYSNTATIACNHNVNRYGGTPLALAVAPTDALVVSDVYKVYDGSSLVEGGRYEVGVVGVIATGDFTTSMEWFLKDGAAASTVVMALSPDDLTLTAATLSFNDTTTQVWEDGSGNLSFKDAVIGTTKTLTELAAGGGDYSVEASVSGAYITCPDNTTTNTIIGTTTDISILLHYVASRTISTLKQQSGRIEIAYEAATSTVYYTSNFIGADLDFYITADLNGSDIRLNIVVGDINTNNLLFFPRIYSTITT